MKPEKDCPTLAILAGGKGLRMGRPKGELVIGGVPILQWQLDRLAWPGQTLLITAPDSPHPPGWRAFDREAADKVAGEGPLRGVLTALQACETETTVVLPVDMPRIETSHLRWLADALLKTKSLGAFASRQTDADERKGEPQGERMEPLPAVFRREAAPMIANELSAGRRSMRGLANVNGMLVVPSPKGWPSGIWASLNTPAELAAFERSQKG